jgi:hypothetical protein
MSFPSRRADGKCPAGNEKPFGHGVGNGKFCAKLNCNERKERQISKRRPKGQGNLFCQQYFGIRSIVF